MAMVKTKLPWEYSVEENWIKARIKYNYYLKGRIGWQGLKADEFIDDGPYLVTGTDFKNGRVNWETCYHISNERYEEAPEIHVQQGDLLVTKDGTIGKTAYIDEKPEKVSLNSHLLLMRPLNNLYSNRFLFWIINSSIFEKYYTYSQTGTIMASLSQEKISNFVYYMPTREEQDKIADYLDDRCSKIDEIIAEATASIEEYRELKQAVIFEAVTKGLDKTVPMKDSGVEWIGQIPLDWSAVPIKRNFDVYAGATPESKESTYWDGDITWITPADFKTDEKYVSNGRRNLTVDGYNACSATLVPSGSIIFSKRAPIGTVAISTKELCTNQGCLSSVPKENIDVEYFYYVMSAVTAEFELYGSGTTFKEISGNNFINMKLPCPPYVEQRKISLYLREVVDNILSLIKEKQALIEDLQAYKKSLIYEVVTGKRRVV